MAKPAIALSSPAVFYAGGDHQIGIEITPSEALRVDYVEARVVGRQGWEVGSGKSRVSHRVVYPMLVTRFMDRGSLPAGATRFVMRFVLPRDLPPSHSIDPAYAQLELQVRIAIPWWFDHKFKWQLPLHVPAPPTVHRTPVAIRSTPPNAAADKPRIEVSLPSTRLIIGESLQGSVAVFHLDDKKPREVELQLTPNFMLLGRSTRERTGGAYGWQVTIPAGSAGQAVPFSLAVPRAAVPSFDAASHRLRWTLLARAGSFFGGKVSITIPLELVDASAAATTARLADAPRLADERVGAVFARFAGTRGWRGHRLGDHDDDDARIAIERELGNSTLRLTYAYREDGTFLVARIATPSLGLGLSVTSSSSLRHVFWKDIEVDITAWDRDHHVTARFADQAIPALKAVVPTLTRLTGLGKLVSWTDDALVFERAVSTLEEPDLVSCDAALEAIAAVIDVARLAVAPPPNLTLELTAWRDLATSLGGELGAGDLSIDGRLGHVPVTLSLVFDSEHDHRPIAFLAGAGDPEHASAAARAVKLILARPAADALGSTQLGESVVEQLTRWPAEIVDLHVEDGVATAQLPIMEVADAARAKELIHGLVAVLATLDPGAGPYR